MSGVTAEFEVSSSLGQHVVKVRYDWTLGHAGTAPYFNSSSGGMVDPGEPAEGGTATIEQAWVVRHPDDKHRRRERPVFRRTLDKLREDLDLEEKLYELAMEGMRDE